MRYTVILRAVLVACITGQASANYCEECSDRCPNRAFSLGSSIFSGVRNAVGWVTNVAKKFVTDDSDALDYLMKFRYVSMESLEVMNHAQEIQRSAVEMFQMMANIPVTGVVDSPTMEMMNTPRCGVPDKMEERRRRRYALDGSAWPKLRISYKINQYSNKVSNDALRRVVADSFKFWSDVSALTFHELDEEDDVLADIEINFVNGSHGDGRPFDGPGRAVGHAFPPLEGKLGLSGDIHFDDEEPWTIGSTEGQDLQQSMTHEIGHALGLAHSMVKGSVMWPFSSAFDPDFALHEDDITAIQAVYGTPDDPKVMISEEPFDPFDPTMPPTDGLSTHIADPLDVPDICIPHIERLNCRPDPPFGTLETSPTTQTTSFTTTTSATTSSTHAVRPCLSTLDAATVVDGRILGFKGNYIYWFITGGVADGFPKRMNEVFPDGPEYVDVAFTIRGRRRFQSQPPDYIYFFKGNTLYKYSGSFSSGFVREECENYQSINRFRGLPANLDAAFQLQQNDIVFIKDSMNYRWSYFRDGVTGMGTSPIMQAVGFPIDAALLLHGRWYFFKPDGSYFRYEVTRREGKLKGPRSTQEQWFRCPESLTAGEEEAESVYTFTVNRYNPFEALTSRGRNHRHNRGRHGSGRRGR